MPSRARAQVLVALMRGINVGGKNKLSMKELVQIFEEAGCSDVRTYVQSGNVVCSVAPAIAPRLPALIAAAIQQRHRLAVPVVTLTGEELAAVVAANPFLPGAEPATLHVAFLAGEPGAAAVAALDPGRSPSDRFQVCGRAVYLCLPDGVARSKLTNEYLDRTLGTVSTLRNWRTTLALLELARASGPVDLA